MAGCPWLSCASCRNATGTPRPRRNCTRRSSGAPAGEYEDIRYETARRDRQDHDRPARGPQRLPAADADRDLRRARAGARGHRGRRRSSSPARETEAFCSGGDQNVRGDTGYVAEGASIGRFHVTDLQVQMRRLPKPVVAMVAGYAVGGGHVLHVCCDLTIAADNARFGQTGPRVGSWDGGFGASLLRDLVGTKKAKEFWLLCRQYDAEEAREMGLVNTVVPLADLERETVAWCREMLALSPFALRLVKASFNAHEDGYAGHPAARPRRQPPLLRQRGGRRGARGVQGEASTRLLQVPEATVSVRRAGRAGGSAELFRGRAPTAVRGCNPAETVQDAPPLADAPSAPLRAAGTRRCCSESGPWIACSKQRLASITI